MCWARRRTASAGSILLYLLLVVLAAKARECSKKDVYFQSSTTTLTSSQTTATIPDDCKVLDLPNVGIGDKGASELAEALKTNTALKELNLQWNNIGVEGTHRGKIKKKIILRNVNNTLVLLVDSFLARSADLFLAPFQNCTLT